MVSFAYHKLSLLAAHASARKLSKIGKWIPFMLPHALMSFARFQVLSPLLLQTRPRPDSLLLGMSIRRWPRRYAISLLPAQRN